jgi:hypothetical protein
VILLQADGDDVERAWKPGDQKSKIQGFIQQTRWRRLKSEYYLEIDEVRRP